LSRSPAQIAASPPPVPARISSMTLRSSFGSDGSINNDNRFSRAADRSSRSFISSRAISRNSASSPDSWNISVAPASSSWTVSYSS